MSEITNGDLMRVLLDVQKDIGGLQADVRNTTQTICDHIADDKAIEKRVGLLENYRSNQAGRARVWNILVALVASAIGAAATLWAGKH